MPTQLKTSAIRCEVQNCNNVAAIRSLVNVGTGKRFAHFCTACVAKMTAGASVKMSAKVHGS